MRQPYIVAGRILAPHGIAGQVKIESYMNEPESIERFGSLLSDSGAPLSITLSRRVTQNVFIAKVAGVVDRTQAEALRHTALRLSRSRLPEPGPEEFYYSDLVGLKAMDPSGCTIGEIASVSDYGAGPVVTIHGARGEIVLPFNKRVFEEVDLALRTVSINLPEEIIAAEAPSGN